MADAYDEFPGNADASCRACPFPGRTCHATRPDVCWSNIVDTSDIDCLPFGTEDIYKRNCIKRNKGVVMKRFMWSCGIEDTFINQPYPMTSKSLDLYDLTGHYDCWKTDFDNAASLGVDAISGTIKRTLGLGMGR